jgi:hypothetical protein
MILKLIVLLTFPSSPTAAASTGIAFEGSIIGSSVSN